MRGGLVGLFIAALCRIPAVRQEYAAALSGAVQQSPSTRRSTSVVTPLRAWSTAAGLTDPTSGGTHPQRAPAPDATPRLALSTLPVHPPAFTTRSPPSPTGNDEARASGTSPDTRTEAAPRQQTADHDRLGRDAASTPGDLATAAYARLAANDRRGAVALFDAALAGADPRVDEWRRQRDLLERRWSASAYSILRGNGPGTGAAVTPVLGGGQSGAALAFTPHPLATRPIALTLRGSVAHDDAGRSSFVAVGTAWRLLPGVNVAAERLIAVGRSAHDSWTVRVAAGLDRSRGRWRANAYGEGGVVGGAFYGALQGRAGAVLHDGAVELSPGAGAWASVQRDGGRTVDRVDVGPGLAAHAGPLTVALDYRVRVAGNATPGSGPVATLSAAF